MSALANAVSGLAATLQQLAGTSVVIRRGALVSDPITATLDRRQYELVDDVGLVTTVTSLDWLFTTTEIVLSGNAIDLRPGDQIDATVGGEEHTYEVLPLGKRPCCEREDREGIITRVHTKEVA